MTDADQRPTPKDSAQVTAEPTGAAAPVGTGVVPAGVVPPDEVAGAGAPGVAGVPDAPTTSAGPNAAPPVEENPYAPPPEDAPPGQSPWGAPPQQPYGQVRPGPVQPWGTQRPRPPEQPTSTNWGDPNRYGPVQTRDQQNPQNDPDRRYRDQREIDRQPQRRERDLPTRWALGLSVGATICTMLAIFQGLSTFPAWMIGASAGLALAVGAFVMAIRAQRDAALRGQRAPEATASLVSASVSGALALILLATSIVWFGPFRDYAKCMQTANTQTAQDACVKQLQNQTGMSTH